MQPDVVLPSPNEPLGSFLRDQRIAAGMTQAQVAERAGIARPNLSAIEIGTRRASPEMALRIFDAIRARTARRRHLELSPPVLLNVELARVAAGHVVRGPSAAKAAMTRQMAQRRRQDDGTARRWLNDWDGILARWDLSELIALLLSTDPDDVERRKVSPINALVSPQEREEAALRAAEWWRATRRIS